MNRAFRLLICGALGLLILVQGTHAVAEALNEYQVKAVFVFNFSHFVAWPAQAFTAPNEPFVIGILGADPFGTHLDETVRGESVDSHPLVVRRFRDITEMGDCQILFIDRSQAAQMGRILAALDHHSTLTVSDLDGASKRGVMIEFATENNRVRLRINPEQARAAGLTISSNLLRLAEVVGPGTRD